MKIELSNLIYEPNGLEKALRWGASYSINPRGIALEETPGSGFHTMWEWTGLVPIAKESAENAMVTVAHIVGGASNGIRYTLVVAETTEGKKIGWERGFRLPVPMAWSPAVTELISVVRGLKSQRLIPVDEIPGFRTDDAGLVHHSDGWWTGSIFGRPVEPVEYATAPYGKSASKIWGKDAKLFSLREGVYVVFPDESYRLVPHRLFWGALRPERQLVGRQGDLLVFEVEDEKEIEGLEFKDEPAGLDRHRVEGGMWAEAPALVAVKEETQHPAIFVRAPFKLVHPEHEAIEVKTGLVYLTLAPGVSRPFARSGGAD